MSGEQTPLRVASSCWIILRKKNVGIKQRNIQVALYASTLLIYILSVGIGAFSASKMGFLRSSCQVETNPNRIGKEGLA